MYNSNFLREEFSGIVRFIARVKEPEPSDLLAKKRSRIIDLFPFLAFTFLAPNTNTLEEKSSMPVIP